MHAFQSLSVPEGAAAIHWFGQSSFALKDVSGTIMQIDPYFPHERPASKFIHAEPPLDETTLRTDFALLTHDHRDHTCAESLLRIHGAFPECRFAGPKESVARMRTAGIPESLLTVVTAGDTVNLGSMTGHTVYSKPPQGAPADDIKPPEVEHMGYVVVAGSVRVYISGDLINTFAEHDELLGPIIDLRPDIGMITTHPTEGEFPFFGGSMKMGVKVGLKAVVPAHYDCFVKRTFDPREWAAGFAPTGPKPVIIPYNDAIVFRPD